MNPRVEHAHYYLGTAAVMEEGVVAWRSDRRLPARAGDLAGRSGDDDPARDGPRRSAPGSGGASAIWRPPRASRRPTAARSSTSAAASSRSGDANDAVVSLRKAVALSANVPTESRIGNLHYQLAQALRQAGDAAAAIAEFTRAAALAATLPDTRRDTLQHYLPTRATRPEPRAAEFSLDAGPSRARGRRPAGTPRHRRPRPWHACIMNLGIMQAQAKRFTRAAELMQLGSRTWTRPAATCSTRSASRVSTRSSTRRRPPGARTGAHGRTRQCGRAPDARARVAQHAELRARRGAARRRSGAAPRSVARLRVWRRARPQRPCGGSRDALLVAAAVARRQPAVERPARRGARGAGRLRRRHRGADPRVALESGRGGREPHARRHLHEAGTLADAAAALRAELAAHPPISRRDTRSPRCSISMRNRPEALEELSRVLQSPAQRRRRALSDGQDPPGARDRRPMRWTTWNCSATRPRRRQHPLPARPGVPEAGTHGRRPEAIRSVSAAQGRAAAEGAGDRGVFCSSARCRPRAAPQRRRRPDPAPSRARIPALPRRAS